MASSDLTTITETGSKTYIINPESDKHVYISHGSAGPGLTEELVAQTLLDQGINVTIFNYFKKHGINKLFWWDHPSFNDQHKVSLLDLANVNFQYGDTKFHIGFSLGGYIGLAHGNQFAQNFCFYPGCLPLPGYLDKFDYSNTKIFTGTNDNWCNEGIEYFLTQAQGNIDVVYLPDCFHSFMSVDKLLQTEVIKYCIDEQFVSDQTLAKIKLSTEDLKKMFSWERIPVTLQSDPGAAEKCLNEIIQDIKNY